MLLSNILFHHLYSIYFWHVDVGENNVILTLRKLYEFIFTIYSNRYSGKKVVKYFEYIVYLVSSLFSTYKTFNFIVFFKNFYKSFSCIFINYLI